MPDSERKAGLLGRQPAVFPEGLEVLAAYLVTQLQPPSYPLDVSGAVTDWGMLGNGPDPSLTANDGQPVGDCGFCGIVHKQMADAGSGHETEAHPDSDEVVTTYLTYDDGQDQGVIMSEMMHAWFESGFFGAKVDGYARVTPDQVDSAMAVFGAVLCGVNLTPDADQLFEAHQPWTVANGEQPDPAMGHVIVKVKADGATDTYVTWGAEQQATRAWSDACIEEAWVPVTVEMARNLTLNIDALLADIRSLGGTAEPDPVPTPPVDPKPPTPAPVPPEPAPMPSPPPPTPAPTPKPPRPPKPGTLQEIKAEAAKVVEEVEELAKDAIADIEGE